PPGAEPGANIAFTPLMRLALSFGQIQMSTMDEASPAWLFLAIRAARRAIHDHPEDAVAWQLLGDAYLALQRQTSERISVANWPGVQMWRNRQTIAAWQQALKLNPDLDATRFNLANLYQSMDQTELALPLYQEALKRQRRTGVSAGDSMEQYSARLR